MARSRGSTGWVIVVAAVAIALVIAACIAALAILRGRDQGGRGLGGGDDSEAAYARLAEQARADRTYGMHVAAPPSHVTMPDRLRPIAPHVYDPSTVGTDGRGVLDVRVHNTQPRPPMHPFALAVGGPFEQVGIVYSLEADKRHPLFSRAAPHHRHRYQYYVSTDDSSIQISAHVDGKDCGESIGCTELYTGDTISVPELGAQTFTVKLFAK